MYDKLAVWRRRAERERTESLSALQAHAGLILRSAVRVLGSVADAEDVAQDVAETLLRRPPRDVRNWPALLKTMAVNASVDMLRKRRDTTDTEHLSAGRRPDDALADAERARALRTAIAALSVRNANLFSLYYLADLSQADIARQLSMSENAVSVALHRIRKKLAADVRKQLRLDEHGAETS